MVTTLPALGFSRRDVQAAVAWAARQGPGWTVEAIRADDGAAAIGVCAPWSDEPAGPGDFLGAGGLAFHLQRTRAGIVAVDGRTWEGLGSFATVGAALDAGAGAAAAGRAGIVANDP